MLTFEFEALSTHWVVMVDIDQTLVPHNFLSSIQKTAELFEQKYSRFKKNNLLEKLHSSDLTITLNEDLQQMLSLGSKLANITDNHFTVTIAELLDSYGYNKEYSFKKDEQAVANFKEYDYTISNKTLVKKSTDTKFDLGSLGKGYLIDLLAKQITTAHIKHFLVDGGGDMFGTSKANGKSWNIALAHPKDKDMVIGAIKLNNSALAVSGNDKRKVGSFHHLLNPKTKQPVNSIASVYVHADSAMVADACATALFVSPEKYWPTIRKECDLEYLLVKTDMTFVQSEGFKGELFKK